LILTSHTYATARIAADTRSKLIGEARARGFLVVVHVMLVPEELAVARVRYRVAVGGHAVPEEKIRDRASTIVAAGGSGDTAGRQRHRLRQQLSTWSAIVAQFSGGVLIGTAGWPQWAAEPLRSSCPP
jgi:predicted ABC-type ATPase